MRNKLSVFFLLLLVVPTLSGCTQTASRIYTVCKVEGSTRYCYNATGEHFKVSDVDEWFPVSSAGLTDKPALEFVQCSGNYSFDKVMPGLYKGTLESVYHYVTYMIENDSATIEIPYRDWNNLELLVHAEKYDTRVVYNIQGDVRIYAVDKSDKYLEPLYLNEKEK